MKISMVINLFENFKSETLCGKICVMHLPNGNGHKRLKIKAFSA